MKQKWFTLKTRLHSFPRLTVVCASYAVNLASLVGLHSCVQFVVCLGRCSWVQAVLSTPLYVALKKIHAWNGTGATRRGLIIWRANPGGRAFSGVVLRPLGCWECGFKYCRSHESLFLVSVVCWQVEVFAWGWSLVQRGSTERDMSECEREVTTLKRPWPTRYSCAIKIEVNTVQNSNTNIQFL